MLFYLFQARDLSFSQQQIASLSRRAVMQFAVFFALAFAAAWSCLVTFHHRVQRHQGLFRTHKVNMV